MKMKLNKRTLKYKAHRVKVFEDEIITPEGEKVYYDFVENRNGSAVLLVDPDGKLLFVKQYRNSVDRYDIEMPAGCVEAKDFEDGIVKDYDGAKVSDFSSPDNPFYKCALRESEEETGLIPRNLDFVNYIIASVGLFSERTAVYIGLDTKSGKENPDFDEFLDLIRLTPEEAMDYIKTGQINDSKTIIAIQYFYMNYVMKK